MEQEEIQTENGLAKRVREFERRCLIRLLRKTGGNVRKASKLVDTRRSQLYRLMHRHGLDIEAFRNPDATTR